MVFFSEVTMKLPSFATIVSVLFLSYLGNLFYSIWVMVQPPTCTSEGLCLKSFLLRKPKLEVCIINNYTELHYLYFISIAEHICFIPFKPSRI